MNIVIGKFGRSLLFNDKKWGAIGGDNEPSNFYLNLAKYNTQDTFYIIGKTDYNLNIPNIVNIWENFDIRKNNNLTWVYDQLKNVKIDGGILFSGPISQVNIPNKILKINSNENAKVLQMFEKYVGPIIYYLNESKIKYMLISPDPRYIKPGRDFINSPQFSLSQYNTSYKYKSIISYDNQKTFKFKSIDVLYSNIEKIFLINKSKPKLNNKTKKMMIVLNEGGNGGLSRGSILKEYILDNIDDIEIYGKWSDEWLKDSRFKGPKKFNNLQKLLYDVKYTLIIPIEKGWVTAKFWEMLYYGIIPFLHPYYDDQKHLPIPDFLRIKSPKELFKKIELLENNKNEYNKLLIYLMKLIKDEYLDGSYLNNIVINKFKEMIK